MRRPTGACQKWLKPTSYSVASDWKLAMWPPSSDDSLLARTTIAIAFQRMIERSRRSIAGSPGSLASRSGGIVFTYGVVMLAIGPLPASWARCDRAREDLAGAIGPVVLDDGIDGLEPLAGLGRVDVSSGAV